jgi:hypothetical protein
MGVKGMSVGQERGMHSHLSRGKKFNSKTEECQHKLYRCDGILLKESKVGTCVEGVIPIFYLYLFIL